MAKKKPTQLDIDITASIKAGMSYGQYIAFAKCRTLPPEVTTPERIEHVCAYCKAIFYRDDHYPAKYCSEYCRGAMKRENIKLRQQGRLVVVQVDPDEEEAILA